MGDYYKRSGKLVSSYQARNVNLPQVKFLGHVIDKDGIRPQPEKLDIIREWKVPKDEADLRRFLGVCTFWRRFVKYFAHIAVPLHDLLNKSEFVWTPQCDSAFKQLKEILCSSVTLKLPDRLGRFIVSCDASDKAVGFVLEQSDASGSRRPVALVDGNSTSLNAIIRLRKRNALR